ncbi:DUF3822 family protein [Urechidicola croceus]|uniref:DUF3822 domain-containing protein n=1 Tax=Urechidicola croceus TaxID=1850246 RepID=A0A1D8P4P2_9FLAO|nr:DUF3822 family protein [Urechidicola croceus]AOW19560.1 hypothetical protein LPB138_02200 [Urechidicola croceus]
MENIDFQNKHLSILLRSDGFSFCVLDKTTEKYSDVHNIYSNEKFVTPQMQLEFIEDKFIKNKILRNAKFQSVNVTHCNSLSTFVPEPFFNVENLASYLKYNIKVLSNDFIAYDTIENTEIVNVYVPFVHINNFLFDKFGSFEYKHSSSVLVETLLKKYTNSDKTHFFVNVENDEFQIIVLKRKKLEFYNSFNFKTKEDFIYYILFTAEQLNLNPEEFQLTLIGEIEKESELYSIVFQYVRSVDFIEYKNPFLTEFETSNHSNFTLLNQQ